MSLIAFLLLVFLELCCAQNMTSNCSTLSQQFNMCMNAVLDDEDLFNDCPDPVLCRVNLTETRGLGVSSSIVVVSVLATVIGSLLPLLPCIQQSDTRPLAAALGLTVGVLLYTALVELLQEARSYFCCLVTVQHVNLTATGTFVIVLFLIFALDVVMRVFERTRQCHSVSCVRRVSVRSQPEALPGSALPLNNTQPLSNGQDRCHSDEGNLIQTTTVLDQTSVASSNGSANIPNYSLPDNDRHIERRSISAASNAISNGTNHIGDASIQDLLSNTSIHRLNAVIQESVSASGEACSHVSLSLMNEDGSLRTAPSNILNGEVVSRVSAPSLQLQRVDGDSVTQQQCQTTTTVDHTSRHTATTPSSSTTSSSNVSALKHGGVLSVIAVLALSLPKGLATYIISHYPISSAAGLALAVTLVVSSLAEGVLIAMLLYYATGSKLKALLSTCFLGSPQLIGAVIGWLIFSTTAATSVCGVCLSALAAMMVYLSLVTLLPISLNVASSTHNSGIFKSSHSSLLVSVFVFIGMLVSAVVLLIVEYAG